MEHSHPNPSAGWCDNYCQVWGHVPRLMLITRTVGTQARWFGGADRSTKIADLVSQWLFAIVEVTHTLLTTRNYLIIQSYTTQYWLPLKCKSNNKPGWLCILPVGCKPLLPLCLWGDLMPSVRNSSWARQLVIAGANRHGDTPPAQILWGYPTIPNISVHNCSYRWRGFLRILSEKQNLLL